MAETVSYMNFQHKIVIHGNNAYSQYLTTMNKKSVLKSDFQYADSNNLDE